ncbi:hypothetical protein I3842_10G116400 [Carya illinoinensis]|uniref:Uncharacterized protein n=1 Tax=Carya illinoinensis TaxID=32201 RepID=A0A922J308_CARIL|nr:hypothetical protein I3842_10G116400 [Carya illinoinensis]
MESHLIEIKCNIMQDSSHSHMQCTCRTKLTRTPCSGPTHANMQTIYTSSITCTHAEKCKHIQTPCSRPTHANMQLTATTHSDTALIQTHTCNKPHQLTHAEK